MRSRILADTVKAALPDVAIAFVLSRQAPYASECPYPTFLTEQSPTQCTAQVNAILHEYRPSIAVFDGSGRAAQYRQAKRLGAQVLFISQHKKKRRRAFAFNRIRHIDAHCITQFKFVDGDLTLGERLKLALVGKPWPHFMGPIFSSPSETLPFETAEPYVVFSAGGGGHIVKGVQATNVFIEAANRWFAQTGEQCHVLLGLNYQGAVDVAPGVLVHQQLPNAQLMALIKAARVVVLGGGAILPQAVALRTPSIAVAVAKDQPARIKAIARAGLTVSCALDSGAICECLVQTIPPPEVDLPVGRAIFISVFTDLIAKSVASKV
ncbi:MAG TPA: hypothetical protein VIC26_12820 [Marinagarivorans sp.]